MATASTRIASLMLAALLGCLCLAGPAPLARADDWQAEAPARAADPGAPTPDYCWFVREVPAILFDREFVTWEDDPEVGKPIPHVPRARWVWAEQWTGPGMKAAPPAGEYASPEERFAETQTFIRLNPDAAPAPDAAEVKVWLPAAPKGQYEDLKRAAEAETDPNLRALLQMIRDAVRDTLPAPAELDTSVFEVSSEGWGIPWIAAVPGPESLEAFNRQKAGIDPAGAEQWRHLLGDSFTSADGTWQWFANTPEALPLYWAALTDRNNPARVFVRENTWKGAWREPWWDADPNQTADPGVPDPGFYRGRSWHPALHKWAGWVPGAITSLSNGVDLKLLYEGSTWDDAGLPVVEITAEPGAAVDIPLHVALVAAPEAGSETPSGPYKASPQYGYFAAPSADSWTAAGTASDLRAHEVRSVTLSVYAPEAGSALYFAAVDPLLREVPFDCNWINNFWAFRITAEQPDLYVSAIGLEPNPASPGESVRATAEIGNDGSRDVTTPVRWILNDDVAAEQEISIPAGGSAEASADLTAPPAAGRYPVGVLANPNRDRPPNERDWDNNYAEHDLSVQQSWTPPEGCSLNCPMPRYYTWSHTHYRRGPKGQLIAETVTHRNWASAPFDHRLEFEADLDTGFGPGEAWFAGKPWSKPWGPWGNEIQDRTVTKAGYALYLTAKTKLATDYEAEGKLPYCTARLADEDGRRPPKRNQPPPAPEKVIAHFPFAVNVNGEWVYDVEMVPDVPDPESVRNRWVSWKLPANSAVKDCPVVFPDYRLPDGDYTITIEVPPCGWDGKLCATRELVVHVRGSAMDDFWGAPAPPKGDDLR